MSVLLERGPAVVRGERLDREATPSTLAGRWYDTARATLAAATPLVKVGRFDEPGARTIGLSATHSVSLAAGTPRSPFAPSDAEEAGERRVLPPALAAAEDLRRWLGLTYEQIARLAGLPGPQTFYYWKRQAAAGQPVRPRAGTVRRLFQVHSMLSSIAATFAGDERRTLHSWVHEPADADRSTFDLLFEGRIDDVYARARPLVFGRGRTRADDSRYAAAATYQEERDEEISPQPRLPEPGAFDEPRVGDGEFE